MFYCAYFLLKLLFPFLYLLFLKFLLFFLILCEQFFHANFHIPLICFSICTVNIRKALQITRVALDAFAVTNRKDVYVFQDIQENAVESIFYLKSVEKYHKF